MKQTYEADKKNWVATDKFSERTPGLFKPEFVGTRGVLPIIKCYLVQNNAGQDKNSFKGVSKKHNDLHFQRYKNVLEAFLKTRRDSELIVTYDQKKLRLSAYYDKRYVLADGIHTRPLDF